MVAVLQRGWHNELARLVRSAQRHLLVAAPFISRDGAALVTDQLTPKIRQNGRAKVYVADHATAIVTSGNLTASAFYRNVEYGVLIEDPGVIRGIEDHFQDFQATGTTVNPTQLLRYASAAAEVREKFTKQQKAVDSRLRRAFQQALGAAEDELIRLRLAGGAVHTVFARTIRYLLNKYGPLPTPRLHELVQQLHPDLCDDTVDRVIDGKRFGKKWKHAVRTAQQQLKRSEEVEYADGLWTPTAT